MGMKVFLKAMRRNENRDELTGTGVWSGPFMTRLCEGAAKILAANGHEVMVSDNKETSSEAVKRSDEWGADIYIALYSLRGAEKFNKNSPLAITCGPDPLAPSSILCRSLMQTIKPALDYSRGEIVRYSTQKYNYMDHAAQATTAVIIVGKCDTPGDAAEMVDKEADICKAIADGVEVYAKARGLAEVITTDTEDDYNPEAVEDTELVAKIVAAVIAALKA